MEVFVSGPFLKFSSVCVPAGGSVADLRDSLTNQKGFPPLDFYVSSNGRLSELQDPVQHGAVYQLLPRLRGGKGGFGSMLRALGAQIEKTTNREACRDLSGRRLRDVNHEKEMAEWLKKQAEREAEKEQRRLERLQRKLSEPKHQFSDAEYQQQCHDLAERLEDSVLKGMQASSSGLVQPAERAAKRTNQDHSQTSAKRKCLWTGAGDLDELDSSEEEEEQEEDQTPSTSASGLSLETQEPEPEDKPEPEPERAAEPEEKPVPEQAAEPEQSSSTAERAEASSSHTQRPQTAAEEPVAPVVPVDLQSAVSAEQLESLGLDVLKEELSRRGLKCGGTLSERAARLFSVRGLKPEQIDPALLAKPAKSKRK